MALAALVLSMALCVASLWYVKRHAAWTRKIVNAALTEARERIAVHDTEWQNIRWVVLGGVRPGVKDTNEWRKNWRAPVDARTLETEQKVALLMEHLRLEIYEEPAQPARASLRERPSEAR